jgi:hypothetical protein
MPNTARLFLPTPKLNAKNHNLPAAVTAAQPRGAFANRAVAANDDQHPKTLLFKPNQ